MHTAAGEIHLPSPLAISQCSPDSLPQFLHPKGKIHHASSQADTDQAQALQLVCYQNVHVQGNRHHSQCSLWKIPTTPTGTSSNQSSCRRFGTHCNKTVVKMVEQEHQVLHAWLSPACMDQVHITASKCSPGITAAIQHQLPIRAPSPLHQPWVIPATEYQLLDGDPTSMLMETPVPQTTGYLQAKAVTSACWAVTTTQFPQPEHGLHSQHSPRKVLATLQSLPTRIPMPWLMPKAAPAARYCPL